MLAGFIKSASSARRSVKHSRCYPDLAAILYQRPWSINSPRPAKAGFFLPGSRCDDNENLKATLKGICSLIMNYHPSPSSALGFVAAAFFRLGNSLGSSPTIDTPDSILGLSTQGKSSGSC